MFKLTVVALLAFLGIAAASFSFSGNVTLVDSNQFNFRAVSK